MRFKPVVMMVERNLLRERWRDMLIEDYCQYLADKGDKAITIAWHREKLEIFRDWLSTLSYLERNKPLSTNMIRAYLAFRERRVSGNTVAGDWRAIKALLAWAHREGHIATNPCAGIKPLKTEPSRQAPFSSAELAKVLSAIPTDSWIGKRNMAIVLFLVDTGIRVTGLTMINNADLDLCTRRVYVTDKYDKKRWLSWGNRTQQALEDYHAARPQVTRCNQFFVNSKLDRLTRFGVYQMFRQVLDKGGVPRRKVHMLRASFACEFLIAGGPERQWQLQLAMGLADDTQVRNVYASSIMSDLTMAAMQELSPADRIPALPLPTQ